MAGKYQNIISFDFDCDFASEAYLELSPFVCVYGYGIRVRIVIENVEGTGDNRRTVFRVVEEIHFTQDSIDVERDRHSETFIEWMEGLYFGKVSNDVAIPIAAMFLRIYCPELLVHYNIPIDAYVKEVHYERKNRVGFGRD
jgi:hypothetical protein